MINGIAIYFLIDPRTEGIRYVGITVNPPKRLSWHLCDIRVTHKRSWILNLKKHSLAPKMRVVCWVQDLEEANRVEKGLVSLLRARGIDLVNSTNGGDGPGAHTEEVKEKIGKGNYGKVMSEDSKAKMSKARKGRKSISGMLGRNHSDYSKSLMSISREGRSYIDFDIQENGDAVPVQRFTQAPAMKSRPLCCGYHVSIKDRTRYGCRICGRTQQIDKMKQEIWLKDRTTVEVSVFD